MKCLAKSLALALGLALAAPQANAASLQQVTGFGTNPTNLTMHLYVPDNLPSGSVGLLLALHYCTGTGQAFYSGTDFKTLADQYKFIVIYPSATRSGQCWDVYSSQGLARNGGSDNNGLISMIDYVKGRYSIDANRVFVTGASSGAMMTNVMLAEYPDVFRAGSAFMGVPYTCFATSAGSTWNSQCANGQVTKTAQQWGDAVRNAYPGFSGTRPRMQVLHGATDSTLHYNNFAEEIKQWTNVLGVSQTPSSSTAIANNCTRTRYGGTGTQAPVEGISCAGTGHNLPLSGQAALAIAFMGLDQTTPGTTYTLTVNKSGSGTGTVSATNGTINCGTSCSATYPSGTAVTLNASAAAGSTFTSWSGACTGTGTCIVTLTSNQTVGAAFTGGTSSSSSSSSSGGSSSGGPTGTVYINAGGPATGSYAADQYFSGGSTYTNSNTIDTSGLTVAAPAALFQTERYGAFTYTIPGLVSGNAYTVTLFFAETYVTSAGSRIFSVSANGTTALSNFDIYAAAGGQNKAIARSITVTPNSSGQIVLQFVAGTQNPKINAIAVAAGGSSSSSSSSSSGGSSSSSSSGGSSSSSSSSGGSSSGGGTCATVSGGQSGNFNTTGAVCYTVNGTIRGWGCSNTTGRTVTVNGTAVTCGQTPLPGSAPYTFSFSAGSYTWASFYWW